MYVRVKDMIMMMMMMMMMMVRERNWQIERR